MRGIANVFFDAVKHGNVGFFLVFSLWFAGESVLERIRIAYEWMVVYTLTTWRWLAIRLRRSVRNLLLRLSLGLCRYALRIGR